MTEEPRRVSRGAMLIAAAAVAGLVAGAIAVYVMGSDAGNSEAAAADCAGALAVAKKLEPFAKGEVAAFRIVTGPDRLSDIAFKAPDGSETSLAAFSGKAVLLNLWATWCVPCREEMPALDRLQAALGGDRFTVLPINIDLRNEARARAFLGEIGVKNLAFYSDPDNVVFRNLKGRGLAYGLPVTLLLDGKGCRIGVVEGPAAWDSDDAKALIGAAIAG